MRTQAARNILLTCAFGFAYVAAGCTPAQNQKPTLSDALALPAIPSVPTSSPAEMAEDPDYVTKSLMHSRIGITMAIDDFDKDGDLDIIVGFSNPQDSGINPGSRAYCGVKLYYFRNDGLGKVTIVKTD
jgi:hypothetical protein